MVLPVLVLAHLELLLHHGVQPQQAKADDAHQPRRPEADAKEQRNGERAVRALAPHSKAGERCLAVLAVARVLRPAVKELSLIHI